MPWSTALQSSSGSSGRAGARTVAGLRSLSLPLLRFALVLAAIVTLGCVYTWEQLVVTRLLDRLQALETTKQRVYAAQMQEIQLLREASSRLSIERAAMEQGLAPLATDKLIIIRRNSSPGVAP